MPTKSKPTQKFTCIIPALNEEQQIASVIDIALQVKQKVPMEIIVVDDGSTDATPTILKKYRDIHVITNQPNKGKSYSVALALEQSKSEWIFMMDSDLSGLTVANVLDLIAPILNGNASVTMSVRRNLTRRDKLEPLTGERIFARTLVQSHIDEIKKLPNFALEVFLNDLIIKHQCSIQTVNWDNVFNENKTKKRGLYLGWKAYIAATRDVFHHISVWGFIRQYIAMRRLLIND